MKRQDNMLKRIAAAIMLMVLLALCGFLAACGDTSGEDAADIASTEATKATVKAGDLAAAHSGQNADSAKDASQKDSDHAAANDAQAAGESADPLAEGQNEYYEDDSSGNSSSGNSKSGKGSKDSKASVCYVSVDDFCSGMEVKWSSGDTAYSVLKKTGAKVSARKTQYGMYVEGINGLFEFDRGDSSGWMYAVNGTAPNKSADKYKVKKGDQVEWYYVTGE